MRIDQTGAISIAGAGLAGTLLAVLLAQRGHNVNLFERNPDQRKGDAPAGRSINLALAERGRHALEMAGLLEKVDQFTLPMRGRMLHGLDGNLTLQPYGASADEVIWSTHRALLNTTLLNAAEETGRVQVFFGHAVKSIDWDRQEIQFADGQCKARSFEVLVGADGGGSAVRAAMAEVSDLGITEDVLDHGYRELTIPPGTDGGHALDDDALHIWPRGGFMLIALPNTDQSFTVTLFLANYGAPSFARLDNWPAQQAFCAEQFPDAFPLLTNLQADFADNPVGLLGTIRCRKWNLGNQAVLIGDAAHAVVPFHGQGMNAAFEDCVAFIECMDDTQQDWEQVFARLQNARVDNSNAIADMALENYGIMREAVRDPRFLLRKALEHQLERHFGERFVARYSLVMFHRLPYAESQRRGDIQANILDTLLAGKSALEEVDMQQAEQLILQQLQIIPDA